MAKKQSSLDSPLRSAFPDIKRTSTKASDCVGVEHSNLIGRVADKTADILATPIGGQRRDATGKYESEPSIQKTQQQEIDEMRDRMNRAPEPWPRHEEGRE